MEYIADFHIHSKYSRATSRDMDLPHIEQMARVKGIGIVGASDFTHPAWFAEIKNQLAPAGNGLFVLRNSQQQPPVFFILTTELSCIYSKGGRVRRIHLVIFAPDLGTVEKINTRLGRSANLKSDGRPILGMDAKELAKIVLDCSPKCLVVPAHIWTPWFSLFGSESGFDSIEECFEELTPQIYAMETGLSSDPGMNWRLSLLDRITLISCSDAHSPANLGREACVFEFGVPSYDEIISTLKTKNSKKLLYTIEFFPEEGKYHYDGHRLCGICFSPEETKKYLGICPQCKKPLTVGVLNRVDFLADRPLNTKPENAIPYKNAVPLMEIIGAALGKNKNTKGVEQEYQKLLQRGGSEFNILLHLPLADLKAMTLPEIAEGIKRMREGRVKVQPGYDGVYGQVKIFNDNERQLLQQDKLM